MQHGRDIGVAAQKALAAEFEARAEKFSLSGNHDIALASDGILRWIGSPIGTLAATEDPLRPRVILLADEQLTGPARDKVAARAERFVNFQIETMLKPLFDLKQAEQLTGIARGIAFRLVEQFRYPIGLRRWEFPQGTAPGRADLDPVALAHRELREETGLRAESMVSIGVLDVAAGMSSQRGRVFVASGITEGEHDREHTEQDMHSEWFEVPSATVQAIAATRAAGRQVVAVGTTTLRALESAAIGGRLEAGARETDIFITPGFDFRVVDRLVTNFHLPKSTLMMLVSAFAGHARVRALYAHAVQSRYRFFSYGDAMLLVRAAA